MKKFGLLIIPIIAISFLTNCGSNKKNTLTITAAKIENCSLTYGDGTVVVANTPIVINNGAITFTCTPASDDYFLDNDSFAFDDDFTGTSSFNENKLVITGITKSCTFSAYAYELLTCFVDFESNGGTAVPTQRVIEGKKVIRPSNPTREGYVFDGWYSDRAFKTPYDFEEIVETDITLYAKWNNAYHFTFSGANCLVNGVNFYETDIEMGATGVEFQIAPEIGYALPTNENFHVTVGSGVTYDDVTGVITISEMVGEVIIAATSRRVTDNTWEFTFSGTNCTMNNEKIYRTLIIKNKENVKFTILPESGYKMPIKADITVTGNIDWDYSAGVLTITTMTSNVTVTAIAQKEEDINYSISFQCSECKAGFKQDGTDAQYQFIAQRSSADDDFILRLFPDEGFTIPNNINVTFSSGPATAGDYSYDRDAKTINILKKDHALISLMVESEHLVTLDAGEGTFLGGSNKFEISVENGTNISFLLHLLHAQPTLKDKLFAFYRMKMEDITIPIEYSDVITNDITLVASYFDTNKPYDNLDNFGWDEIKQVAVTNPNPTVCFNIGATRTVVINGQKHQTCLIGLYHDELISSTASEKIYAGFTFEFANVISNHQGLRIDKAWNLVEGKESYNYNYTDSSLNNYLNTDADGLISILPYDLLINVAEVYKNVGVNETETPGRTNYNPSSFKTKFFPLAYVEMFNDFPPIDIVKGEGSIYEYYKDGTKSHAKKDVSGIERTYWLRSPNTTDEQYACCKGVNIEQCYNKVNDSWSFAPAFCI